MVPALRWCTRLIARRVLTSWKTVRYTDWFCAHARRPEPSQSSKARTKLSRQRQSQKKKQPLKLSRLKLKKPSPSPKKKTPSSRKRNCRRLSARHNLIHFRYPVDQTFQLKTFIRRAVTTIGRQFSQRAAN